MLNAYLQGIVRPHAQHREEKLKTNKRNKPSFFSTKTVKSTGHRNHETQIRRVRRCPELQTVRKNE